jgi:hypothetical protein
MENMEELKKMLIEEIEKEVERTIKSLSIKYNLNEADAVSYIMNNERQKRGRPVKEEEEKREKGPRGRPPKEEKEVKHYSGEDLISRLLEEARKKASITKKASSS